jgi:hypothetical protein
MWRVVHQLPEDYESNGNTPREDASDCSCGCRYFIKLAGPLGMDWGICANPASHRAGLLTFEHQGCLAFEDGDA